MAGDWIPMRLDLYEDPAVTYMAERIGQREEVIVGYLHRIWAWASRQCHDGCVRNVTASSLGRVTSLPDFPDLMAEAGWLEFGTDEQGRAYIRFPNWDRWLGESAKKRLSASRRKQKERVTQMSQEVVTNVTKVCDKSVTTVQESREEKDNTKVLSKRESGKPDPHPAETLDGDFVLAEWNRLMGQSCRWTAKRQTSFSQRRKNAAWRDNWHLAASRAAASSFCRGENDRAWVADFEWFLKPDTVTKLLEGKYDDREPKAVRTGGKTFAQQAQSNMAAIIAKAAADDAAAGRTNTPDSNERR